MPPTVKLQIKRLEELLAEAVAVPTNHQAMEDFYEKNPDHPYAGIRVTGFMFNPEGNKKRNSPTLALRIRHALTQIAPDTALVAELTKKDSLEEHMIRLRAAIGELKSGNLNTIHDLAHAEVFDDVLDQAQYLLDQGYVAAAAVTAGTVFESHLKQLAAKNGVATVDANNKPIKADTINADMVKAGAYNKTKAKQVTAWQGTRNDAAHPNTMQQVTKSGAQDLIDGLRRFVVDYPA